MWLTCIAQIIFLLDRVALEHIFLNFYISLSSTNHFNLSAICSPAQPPRITLKAESSSVLFTLYHQCHPSSQHIVKTQQVSVK